MDQQNFFSGLRVVELASVLAGPAVGMFFAELGAEVIKIENKTTGGDVTRSWKLPSEAPDSPVSAYFASVNWGKQHRMLDLNDAVERAEAHRLALDADIVISNYKPSAAARFGLDAQALRAEKPALIYAQLNAFPDSDDERPAFDVVLQAEAGFLYMCGEPGREPVKMPVALIDLLAAHQLKEGILLALLRRAQTGQGASIECSLLESALASLANQASNYLMAGHIPQPMGTQHPNIAPYGDMFTCADGQLLLLAAGTEKQFRHLCGVLQLESLVEEPEFSTNAARVRNRARLRTILSQSIRKHPLDTLLRELHQQQVPAARIRDMRSVFDLETAQKMILEENIEGCNTRRVRSIAFSLQS